MYSTINRTKWGNCSQCSNTDCACVKVGKELVCEICHKTNKAKKQIANATLKNKVRGLISYERAEGIIDSISELTIDLDRVISRYIRLRDMGRDHKIICYTCDKPVPYQKAHAMHFINRQHMATRFLLQNLKSGCFTCNVEKRGNLQVYAERLNRETPGIVEWLQDQSHSVAAVTRDELKMLLFDIQQKLKTVEVKLK